jgi:type I restriction enzyme M protein
MFETTFRNLDDTLRKDAGCSSELDYIEQTSWVLFLKYLDDFEADRAAAAELNGERYQCHHTHIIKPNCLPLSLR